MTTTATPKTIKLMKFYVTDGENKARVWYSRGPIFIVPGKPEMVDCVTIYAREYNERLAPVFGEGVENDTDMMTDYFEKDRVRIFAGSPLWAEACARAERKG